MNRNMPGPAKLSPRQFCRLHPQMLIGSGEAGLHGLVLGFIDVSVEKALRGEADVVVLTLHQNGSVTIADNAMEFGGAQQASDLLETIEIARKRKPFWNRSRALLTQLVWLTEWCKVELTCADGTYVQEYDKGNKLTHPELRREFLTEGCQITFTPDPDVFPSARVSHDIVRQRMMELAFLLDGVTTRFTDNRSPESFQAHGLVNWLHLVNKQQARVHEDMISREASDGKTSYAIAAQFLKSGNPYLKTFVNARETRRGSHLDACLSSFHRVFNEFARSEGVASTVVPNEADYRQRLALIISVQDPGAVLLGPCKDTLHSPEIARLIEADFGTFLRGLIQRDPALAHRIVRLAIEFAANRAGNEGSAKS